MGPVRDAPPFVTMPVEETTGDFDLIFGDDDGTGSLILKSSPIAPHKRSASVLAKDEDEGVREEIIVGNVGVLDAMDGREEDEVDYEIGGESPMRVEFGSASTPVKAKFLNTCA